MRVGVKLPPDPLINYLTFCKAIGQAASPAGEQGLTGIDCIVGKRVKLSIPTKQPAGNGDDGSHARYGTLDLPLAGPAHGESAEVAFPSDLTNDERRTLQKLLLRLPPLRCPISNEAAAAFFGAYRKLRDRPKWEPDLVTAANVGPFRAKQDAATFHHQQTLWNEFKEGRLTFVDRNHVPAERPDASDFIPRDQAIAYLDRCGFPQSDDGTQSVVGQRKVDDPEAVYEFCLQKLKEKHNNYNELTAEEFGITGRHVRKIINQIDEARGKPSPFPKQGGKRQR